MAEQLIGQFGYAGIALLLILGGLGLPVPEEAPIILAAVLSRNGSMWWPIALASCFVGVLVGDFVVYFLGYFYGEKVLSLPLTRKLLTRAREAQIKGYFHRHGFKILILGRFAVGFRTAAYLTAGILKLPPWKLFVTDAFAASLSTLLMFGLGYLFAHQIQSGLREAQHWATAVLGLTLVVWLLVRYVKARRRAGLPVGPPVLVSDDVPLPPDDLHAGQGAAPGAGGVAAIGAALTAAEAVAASSGPLEPAPPRAQPEPTPLAAPAGGEPGPAPAGAPPAAGPADGRGGPIGLGVDAPTARPLGAPPQLSPERR